MPRSAFALSVLFFISACQKDDSLWKINNLNGNRIAVFGHGGMGTRYSSPMNSMHSLNEVLSQGAFGTEMDVEMTRDNVLMLYHDVKLEDGTECDGKIEDQDYSSVKGCRYKLPLTSKAGLISAADFFGSLSNRQHYYYTFDTKVNVDDDTDRQKSFAEALYALIKQYDLKNNCFIESYSIYFLKLLKAKDPALKLFIHSDNYANCLQALEEVELYGITMDRERISAAEIDDAHRHNLRVTLFNLETEEANIEGIKMNPDFMQTDRCDFLLNALK